MNQIPVFFPLKALVTNRMLVRCFASASTLSGSAQKAVWATAVIRKIIQGTPLTTINDPSLRQAIINLPNPSQQYIFQEKYKAQVMKLFQDGVMLNGQVYVQKRFKQAKQNTQKKNGKTENPIPQSFKFVFCPNNLVTQEIFSILQNPSRQKRLITGGFGISKSIALILFIRLNYYPLKLYFQAKKQERQSKQDLLNELTMLKQKGLLQQKFHKYFYWTAELNTPSLEQLTVQQSPFLINRIKNQIEQLGQQQKQRILKSMKIVSIHDAIKTLYPQKDFIVRPVVDQINAIASLFRKYNQKMKDGDLNKEVKFYEEQDYRNCRYMDLILKRFLAIGNYNDQGLQDYILNSSVTIQSDILSPSSSSFKLSLNIDQKQRMGVDKYKIAYEKKLSTMAGRIDFCHIFIFEIERFLINKEVQSEIREKICKKLKEKIISKLIQSLSWFARFLYIRKYLQDITLPVNDLSKPSNQAKFIEEIVRFVEDFPNKCRKDYEEQMKIFLGKGETQAKLLIIKTLYYFACSEINNKDRCNENFQILSQTLFKALSYVGQKIAQHIKQQKNWKYLFFAQTFDDGKAKFPWTPMQFIQFTTPIVHPQIHKKYDFFIRKDEKEFYTQFPPSKGNIVEYYLRQAIGAGSNFIIKAYKDEKSDPTLYSFQIQQQIDFRPFNKRGSPPVLGNIAENFQEILAKAKKNPEKFYLGTPYYTSSSDGKRKFVKTYAFNSQAIDFAIVRYRSASKKYEIFTFDVTIQTNVAPKMQKALRLFSKIYTAEKERKLFIHRHIVICPREIKSLNHKFKFEKDALFTFFDGFSFSQSSDQHALQRYREFAHWIKVELLAKAQDKK